MPPECECGHSSDRHRGEPPYPCQDCDCRSFRLQWEDGGVSNGASETGDPPLRRAKHIQADP